MTRLDLGFYGRDPRYAVRVRSAVPGPEGRFWWGIVFGAVASLVLWALAALIFLVTP